MTRIQFNVLANLIGHCSAAVLGIVCVPWYVQLLGLEAYGIVALHSTLYGVFGLMDLGLSTAVSRQLAWLSGQHDTVTRMLTTVRSFSRIYWLIVVIASFTLYLIAPFLAERWFRLEHIDPAELTTAIRLMAMAVFFQWPAAFYAGCLAGLQHQTRLNFINLTVAIVRFPGAILLLAVWSPSLPTYFVVQAIAGAIHTVLTSWAVRRTLLPSNTSTHHSPGKVESIWRFASGISGIAVTALVLILADKFLLSTLLPLDQFGGYMLAATIAGGLGILSGAVYSAALPRLAELVAAGIESNVQAFYHDAAQFLGTLLFPISAVLVIYAESVIRVWTGNADLAVGIAPQVRLLIAGSTLMSVYLIPIALQYAHGWTLLTLILNAVMILVQVPLLVLLTRYYGGNGAALVWLLLGIFNVVVGPPLMHRRLLFEDLLRWYAHDVMLPALPSFAVCGFLLLVPLPTERILLGLFLMMTSLTAAMATFFCVPVTRRWALSLCRRLC